MRELYGYHTILVLNSDGQVMQALGELTDVPPVVQEMLGQSIVDRQIHRIDLQDVATRRNHLDWLVPLVATGPTGQKVIGAILLRVAPEDFLLSLMQNWPGTSRSAESLLVRRDGEHFVVLSQLRHPPTGGAGHLPLGEQTLAAMATLRSGTQGILKWEDERGVPVLAAYRPVPETSWYILAKIDQAEVMTTLRELVLWVTALATIAFLVIGGALLGLWRQQRRAQTQELLARTSSTNELVAQFFELPFIGMAMTSPTSKYWLRFNDRLCDILGYPRVQLATMTWAEITHPEDLDLDVAEFERVLAGETEGYRMDKRFVRQDGTIVYATIDVRVVRKQDGAIDYFLATVQDISERIRNEQQLQRQHNLYAALSGVNTAIVRGLPRDKIFLEVCRIAVERAGFLFAWIGLAETGSRVLRPVARFGEDQGYVNAIHVRVDPDDPEGAGPGGRAVRLGVHQIVNDIQAEPAMAPWRDSAARAGVRSVAAFPVREAGRVTGALSVYAADAGRFDVETVALLHEMATDLSFALDNLDRERARSEAVAELEQAEARWHFALEGANHGVWEWNIQTSRVFYSQQWKKMLGFDDNDIGDQLEEWKSRIHPDEVDTAWQELNQHLAGETPDYVSEHRVRCKDGGYKWVQARGKVMTRDPDGHALLAIGTTTDISEQRESDENLRASEGRFRRAVEESPFPAMIHAEDGTVLSLSRAWTDLSGYSREDIPTMADWLTHAYGSRMPVVQEYVSNLFDLQARKDEGEYRIHCKDGTERTWDFSSISLGRQPDGRRVAMSMAADVTERKRIEQALVFRGAALSAVSHSTRQILATSETWRDVVDEVLAGVGSAAEVSRAYLFETIKGSGATMVSRQTHEWVAPGVTSFLHDRSLEAFSWADYGANALAESLAQGEPVFGQVRQLPEAFAALLDDEEVQSIALVPVMVEGDCWGFMGFDDCQEAREWTAAEGEVLGLVATTMAAAIQQEAARTELVDSERRFRGLVEQSLIGIAIVDRDLRIMYSNPRAAEIVGCVPAEVEGRPFTDFAVDIDLHAAMREAERLFSHGARIGKFEFTARHQAGHVVTVGAEGLLTTRDGEPAVLCVMQDISEKKRSDEQAQRYLKQIETAFMSTVTVATTLSEMRDPYTTGHERRVAGIAKALGARLGLDSYQQEGLEVCGQLHDVGKITVPSEILAKPGRLSAIEFELIKSHAQSGYDVLKSVEFPWPVAQVALQHHERMDGSGYPQGLKGDDILLEARIMAVADVVEAMATHRPYRAGLGIDVALAEIERGRGTAYDADVADTCLELFHVDDFTIPD